jgi:4-amino-4-deoxy-L-arabinose transferase-like glycosyltransferase
MGGLRLGVEWQSPAAMPRRWLASVFGIFAIFATLVAIFSTDNVHQLWGTIAACGYGLAMIAVLVWKERGADAALVLGLCGALLVPLAWMASNSLEQPEVTVVATSAASLIHHGTPYTDVTTLAGTTNPNAYNPYLPVMAVFGMPRAIFGGGLLTDPRVWFGVVFLIVFWLALRRGGARDPWRWAVFVAASPVIAFELAVGGTDVPMVAFLCLGFAILWEQKMVLAGLALGLAASMKATAWPALLVAIALLAVRDGKRAVRAFTLTALAVVAVLVGPIAALHPRALWENTIKFPLGLAHVTSQASSPLPGHDIAATGQVGHTIVVVLLVLAGLAVAVSLVLRPPRTVPRAVLLLAGAMTLMFVLAPSTRFGYLIYPATLAIWLLAVVAGRAVQEEPVTPNPDVPPASTDTSWQTSPATRPAA